MLFHWSPRHSTLFRFSRTKKAKEYDQELQELTRGILMLESGSVRLVPRSPCGSLFELSVPVGHQYSFLKLCNDPNLLNSNGY